MSLGQSAYVKTEYRKATIDADRLVSIKQDKEGYFIVLVNEQVCFPTLYTFDKETEIIIKH
ncbi:MAG: hypothetical protein [Caudoviricetes sp.]|nr:MAG: hypothetical protein [Caudoviricetes sp.]